MARHIEISLDQRGVRCIARLLDDAAPRTCEVATPYDGAVTVLLSAFLEEAGFEVVSCGHLGLSCDIAKVGYAAVRYLARAVDRVDADAVFLSCTNLRTFDVLGGSGGGAGQAGPIRQPGHDVGGAARWGNASPPDRPEPVRHALDTRGRAGGRQSLTVSGAPGPSVPEAALRAQAGPLRAHPDACRTKNVVCRQSAEGNMVRPTERSEDRGGR